MTRNEDCSHFICFGFYINKSGVGAFFTCVRRHFQKVAFRGIYSVIVSFSNAKKKDHRKTKSLIEFGEKCLFMLPSANTVVQMCLLTVIVVKEYIVNNLQ